MLAVDQMTINEIKQALKSRGHRAPSKMIRSKLVEYARPLLKGSPKHRVYTPRKRSPKKSEKKDIAIIKKYLSQPIVHHKSPKHISPRHTGHHTYSKKQMRELMSQKELLHFIHSEGFHPPPKASKEELIDYAYNLRI